MAAALYFQCDMSEPALWGRLGGRAVAAYSSRSPFKETVNEDAAAVIPWDEHSAVLAVADGLGGAARGEEASRRAIQELADAIDRADRQTSQLRTAILDGIESANGAVMRIGAGAATTLAVVEVTIGGPDGDLARTYHVGDAGVLVCGGRGKVKLLTTAHSPVGYGVEAGLIDHHEAMHHDERHLVSNVVGAADSRIEIGAAAPLAKLDTVLVASDGLFDNLTVAEIVSLVRRGPAATAAQRVAQAARERMLGAAIDLPAKADDLTLLVMRRG